MDGQPGPDGHPFAPRADPAVQKAQERIGRFFRDSKGRPNKKTYYKGQLEVLLEGEFFSWVVSDALGILVEDGRLKSFTTKTKRQPKVIFYHNATLVTDKETRIIKTRAKRACSLIDKMSDPIITKALGGHLEALVKAELRAQQFDIVGENTNSYQGVVWTETGHNLDFIAKHHSDRLVIGVEVKNTLAVVPKDEVSIKLRMCEHLGITPVFAVRWNKPYLDQVYKANGFTWTFKTQIYPLGQENLTKKIYDHLGLPVNVRTDLPPKSVKLFQEWVKKRTGP
jgi:hypothetical protein